MKNDAYHLEHRNSSTFNAACEEPGKDGDLVSVDGRFIYFEPIRKFTMIGPPLVPLVPVNFGFGKDEIKLMFAPGGHADPEEWRIQLMDSGQWIVGTAGESRLGKFISFKVQDLPDRFELQFTESASKPPASIQFRRHGNWIYRPVIGLAGEKLRGWVPGCAEQ